MKTIVVCGGSKGIGAATSRQLIQEGFNVICLSRTIGELADIIDNSNFTHYKVDLCNKEERIKVISKLISLAEIWGVVNNSSGPSTGAALDVTSTDYISAFEGHLFAANEIIQSLLPKMIKGGEGRIVNIISVTAKIPLPNMIVSNTLRGAMINWSKTLSKELAQYNIKVNNVLPGYTKTQRLVEVIKSASVSKNISFEAYESKLLEQIPLGRFGNAEELGSVVLFLMSKGASYISGVSIPVDGGWTTCV